MERIGSSIEFNGICYKILNKINFKDIDYFLILNEQNNNYKVVYEYKSELFQVINNKDCKEIMAKLIEDINI